MLLQNRINKKLGFLLSALQQDVAWIHIYEWHSTTIILTVSNHFVCQKHLLLGYIFGKKTCLFSSFQPFSPGAKIQVLFGTALPCGVVQNNPNPTLTRGNWNEKYFPLQLKAV